MIIISTQCFPPTIGGIENLVYNLALHLSRYGYDTKVYADSTRGRDSDFDKEQPFEVSRYSGWKPLRRRKKASSISRILKQGHCAALITDSWKSLELIRPILDIPLLCLAHGTELPCHPDKRKLKRIKKALAKATVIIANSNYTATRLSPFVENREKISVIYPGIGGFAQPDESITESVKKKLGGYKHVLISVGRIEKRKGIDTIIRVMPRLLAEFPGAVYVVIGSGSQVDELQSLARSLGVSKNILFLGYQDTAVRNAWLKCSDIFVLPVRQEKNDVEGFGIVFTEAALFGVPSVAGNSGGAKEAVIHDKTGLVCDGDDPGSVSEAISQLLGNETRRKALGENARQRANTLLWDNIIGEYIRLIEAQNKK